VRRKLSIADALLSDADIALSLWKAATLKTLNPRMGERPPDEKFADVASPAPSLGAAPSRFGTHTLLFAPRFALNLQQFAQLFDGDHSVERSVTDSAGSEAERNLSVAKPLPLIVPIHQNFHRSQARGRDRS
jgi:hypothetical protein